MSIGFWLETRSTAITASVALLSAALLHSSAMAFDAAKVPAGVYYNATALNEQLWTPLLLAQDGRLVDPLAVVASGGLASLEGEGRTTLLQANTAYLYGACEASVTLAEVKGFTVATPTVYVREMRAPECRRIDKRLHEGLKQPGLPAVGNPFPTFEIRQPAGIRQVLWAFGAPGLLGDPHRQIAPQFSSNPNGPAGLPQGVASRSSFMTLPVLEPDFIEKAHLAKQAHPGYRIGAVEAVHRSGDVAIRTGEWERLLVASAEQLAPRFQRRLLEASASAFKAKPEPFVELGLVLGVDLDGTGKVDRVGVTRIGARLPSGIQRWIDVIWCVRLKADDSLGEFEILQTTERLLYDRERRFFVNKNPSLFSPHLTVSAVADFDKDKRLEVVTTALEPVGNAYEGSSRDGSSSRSIWVRRSSVYAHEPQQNGERSWSQVYQSSEHEERKEALNVKEFTVVRFGE